MNSRLRAYLELVRVPNVLTAVADVTAAYLYCGGGSIQTLIFLGGASACLYAGGVALNDVCDAARDLVHRLHRPIPSARVSSSAAMRLVVLLFTTGIVLAAVVSTQSVLIASGLLIAIIAYNRLAKSTPFAPIVMGLCRALNLALGMSVAVGQDVVVIAPVALMLVYVAALTAFARSESEPVRRGAVTAGVIGMMVGVAGLASLYWILPNPHAGFLGLVLLLVVVIAWRGGRVLASPEPQAIQSVVGMLVTALVVFDGCIVWAARGPWLAMAVLAFVLPTVLLSRWFRMS